MKYFNVRKFFVFACLVFLLLLSNCSEDAPTKPEEKKDDASATQTIDASGGTIETEDFKLEVPPGAFGNGVELKLFEVNNNTADANSVTKAYQLKGLPDEITKPIKLGVKYSGTLKNESFIRVKQKFLFEETGDTINTSNLIPAIDSSGFIWTSLPLRSSNRLSKENSINFFVDFTEFFGVSDFTTKTSSHFSLTLPTEDVSKNTLLLEFLENNYTKIKNNLGLDFSDRWWSWPIKVVSVDVKENASFLYLVRTFNTSQSFTSSAFTNEFGIDKILLNQIDFNKTIVELGKDLLNLDMSIRFDTYPNSWVRGAIYAWSEELFTEDQNFISPEKFSPNAMLPLNIGMAQEETLSQSNLDHGDGMSSVIKYLVDDELKFGKEGIKKTLESIQGGANPVTALINNVNSLKAEWLLDFFSKYVGGKIYNVPASAFLDKLNGVWDIKSDADTLMEFKPTNAGVGKMPDLSAQLFLVNLKNSGIDASKDLTIDVEGDVNSDGYSTIIFGYKNEKLEHLIQGYASESILEIPSLKNSGYTQFLIVVINSNGVPPYDSESNAYLTLKVEGDSSDKNDEVLKSNKCFVWVNLTGHYRKDDGLGGVSESEDLTLFQSSGAVGSFNGNVFVGTYDDSTSLGKFVGTITVTLNEDLDKVSSVLWSQEQTNIYTSQATIRNTTMGGVNIPISTNPNLFQVIGNQTCSHLTDEVAFKRITSNGVNDQTRTLISYKCGVHSYIKVTFGKE